MYKRAFPATFPRRVTRRHSRGRCLPHRGSAHIRQYHQVFLNPYYGSRRTCVPLLDWSEALTKPRKRERSEGLGRGEKRERIQFLGCILKSADLSTATRANIVDELRVFLFVRPLWPSTLFILFFRSFYIRRKWNAFHLVGDFLAGCVKCSHTAFGRRTRVSEKRYLVNNINTAHSSKSRLNWIEMRCIFGYAPPWFFSICYDLDQISAFHSVIISHKPSGFTTVYTIGFASTPCSIDIIFKSGPVRALI